MNIIEGVASHIGIFLCDASIVYYKRQFPLRIRFVLDQSLKVKIESAGVTNI